MLAWLGGKRRLVSNGAQLQKAHSHKAADNHPVKRAKKDGAAFAASASSSSFGHRTESTHSLDLVTCNRATCSKSAQPALARTPAAEQLEAEQSTSICADGITADQQKRCFLSNKQQVHNNRNCSIPLAGSSTSLNQDVAATQQTGTHQQPSSRTVERALKGPDGAHTVPGLFPQQIVSLDMLYLKGKLY